jgi:hypothetical protein
MTQWFPPHLRQESRVDQSHASIHYITTAVISQLNAKAIDRLQTFLWVRLPARRGRLHAARYNNIIMYRNTYHKDISYFVGD